MALFLYLLTFGSLHGQETGNVIQESGMLGVTCVVALGVSVAILGIVVAALKDDRADQYYQ
jgi:hypothetical protein